MVESACLNIANWPTPVPGSTLELPLLGSVLNVALPLKGQAQYPTRTTLVTNSTTTNSKLSSSPLSILTSTTLPPPILPATHPLTPLSLLLFSPQSSSPISISPTSLSNSPNQNSTTIASSGGGIGFSKLLLIWELLVLEEPLLIHVNDPKTGSELLYHLRNLIRPVSKAIYTSPPDSAHRYGVGADQSEAYVRRYLLKGN
jgi:hypothetical protein